MDVVVATWKDLQWNDLQNVIETEISALGERQDKGEEGRQQLLGESNKYRENTTKESRAVAVPLIKAFQKEVDGLSIRCKATEAALIHICSSLTNIPDPSAILEQAVSWKTQAEKTNRAVEEAEQLRLQIQDLHSEFADLKNQDVTIRQLRERIKQLESEKTIEVEQSIGETERLLREEFIAKEHEMSVLAGKLKTENNSLENKVSELEVRMRDAQRKLDSARVVADQQDMFESEQISILTRDLDTSQRRVAKLEEELSRLTRELSEEQSRQKMGGIEDIATLGGIMKDKDEQIAKLAAENKRLQEVSVDEIKKAMTARDELARQVERQNEQLRQMQVQLADRSDYEAIKKELRLLREMEFGETAEANAGAIARLGDTVQSLDRLLAEKNKRLQNDNAQLRQANQRFQETITIYDAELAELKGKTQDQANLVIKLEKDLTTLAGSSAGTMEELSTLEALGAMASSDSGISGGDKSMTGILKEQRDRYKTRCGAIEEELSIEKSRLSTLQSEMEKVREDNVKLYGRIRFLQSYGNRSGGESGTAVDAENAYSEQYEKRLDPFRKFNQTEKQRTYTRLSLHDRATLKISRAIMTSSVSRMIFFFYLLALHLMVFLVLYRFAYGEKDRMDNCVENFAKHMEQHHLDNKDGQ